MRLKQSTKEVLMILFSPSVVSAVMAYLLLCTSWGRDMPVGVQIGFPILTYVVSVWFLLAHHRPK